jgi:twinkle protein
MFDMDAAGRRAADIAAQVIGADKACIAHLPLKDPNEMLVAGRYSEMIDAMWKATAWRPEGMVQLGELKDAVLKGVEQGISWPWDRLTRLTRGRRLGELYALGAGTGIGKTTLMLQVAAHTVTQCEEPIGLFYLEQTPTETALRFLGICAERRFHDPDGGWQPGELDKAWEDAEGFMGMVHMYDSFGVNEWDAIEDRIRYLYHAHDVKHFFIDHLTALAEWVEDTRKALEIIMAKMGGLVKELNCCIYFVSHLATPDQGMPHEEGGRVFMRHFKGSRSIGAWSHFAFGLERDQQARDIDERHTLLVRVLKDRFTGQATGETFELGYDMKTGLLYEKEEDVPF